MRVFSFAVLLSVLLAAPARRSKNRKVRRRIEVTSEQLFGLAQTEARKYQNRLTHQ
jgi:hypothetical protein